jgi:hypothetical protein
MCRAWRVARLDAALQHAKAACAIEVGGVAKPYS